MYLYLSVFHRFLTNIFISSLISFSSLDICLSSGHLYKIDRSRSFFIFHFYFLKLSYYIFSNIVSKYFWNNYFFVTCLVIFNN